MLLYLDNQASIGPNSRAGRFINGRGKGRKVDINENLAREILELHTLGVDGGYTQADVTTFAKAISGWSIGGDEGNAASRAWVAMAASPENSSSARSSTNPARASC